MQAIERQVEFLGGDLRQRGDDALTEFHLAGAHRRAAIGRDADPGIEHAVAVEATRQGGWLLAQDQFRSKREGDHDAAKTCTKAGGELAP